MDSTSGVLLGTGNCDPDRFRGIGKNAGTTVHDNVNHPSHYNHGKIEVIEFIEDKQLGFHLGNTVKYVARAGKKDPTKTIEDLEKAEWYLSRKILQLKAERNGAELVRPNSMPKRRAR